jgi:hypothetical protein
MILRRRAAKRYNVPSRRTGLGVYGLQSARWSMGNHLLAWAAFAVSMGVLIFAGIKARIYHNQAS